jgi:hypothetical protein
MAAHRFGFEWSAFVVCSRGATAVQYLMTLGLVALTGSVALREGSSAAAPPLGRRWSAEWLRSTRPQP